MGIPRAASLLASPLLLAEGGGASLITPELGTVVWTVATFAVLFFLLWWFAWGPISKALEAREHRIEGDVKRAEEARLEAERLIAEHQRKLDQVRDEAQAIIAEGKADGEKLRETILSEARAEAERTLTRARRDVDLAKEQALLEIRQAVAALAVQMAEKAVGRVLSPAEESRLRDECLAEFAGEAGRGGRG
ncbi:MAG: F0F1 ATP synthase subunit B [Planctomycetales bacterium]|nr:F0F1 ATP synthase subunit B [Planctomycetales bacterium]